MLDDTGSEAQSTIAVMWASVAFHTHVACHRSSFQLGFRWNERVRSLVDSDPRLKSGSYAYFQIDPNQLRPKQCVHQRSRLRSTDWVALHTPSPHHWSRLGIHRAIQISDQFLDMTMSQKDKALSDSTEYISHPCILYDWKCHIPALESFSIDRTKKCQ